MNTQNDGGTGSVVGAGDGFKRIPALVLLACTICLAYGACYIIVTPPCTRAGEFACIENNPSDPCPDLFFWNQDSDHKNCYLLSETGGKLSVKKPGKTLCDDYPRGMSNLGTWTRDVYYLHPFWGYCYYSHSDVETKAWRCDDASFPGGAQNCEGWYP
jgi:hypothetical protein